MNKVILVGRLGQDPEVRYTQSGKAVCTFNLAVNRRVASGAHPEADWVPIVVWEKLAEICGNNLLKGSRILVEGRLQIRTYEANDGQKRRIAEVIAQSIEFLEKKRTPGEGNTDAGLTVDSFGKDVFPDEEIPF